MIVYHLSPLFAVHISDGVLQPSWEWGGFAVAALLALFGAWRIRDEEIPRVAVMTARPSRIKSEVPIDLSHPRHYTIKTGPAFSALKARLTEEIRVEALHASATSNATAAVTS